MILTSLLQNAYNAYWPKQFNSEPFFLDEDLTPVTRDSQIAVLDDEMQRNMAQGLLDSNEHMKGTPFYGTYIFPLSQELNRLSTPKN